MMEKNINNSIAKMEEAIKSLPEKAQEAICWVIMHLDFVEKMCKNLEMTDEELKKHKEDAKEKGDYLMGNPNKKTL